MPLLIDGYNLLHATGLFGRGPGSFEASRSALLGFLVAAIDATERTHTTVVFDAAAAPPGLPRQHTVGGITVHFAQDYESADDLLEELIARHHAPRKLIVVSSDHRVQRAAKKRRATAIDSHVWYGEVAARLQSSKGKRRADLPDTKPDLPLSPGEVAAWVRMFGPVDVEEPTMPAPVANPQSRAKKKSLPKTPRGTITRADEPLATKPRAKRSPRSTATPPARVPKKPRKPKNLGFGDITNPFPPGYGEDVK